MWNLKKMFKAILGLKFVIDCVVFGTMSFYKLWILNGSVLPTSV